MVGRRAFDGPGCEARVGGSRAYRVPDVRVGGEEEGHVVGDHRVDAVDGRAAAELPRIGGRQVDDRCRARGVGEHGAHAEDRGEVLHVRHVVDANGLRIDGDVDERSRRARGAGDARGRTRGARRGRPAAGCGLGHGLRLRLRRGEADGAEAVVETMDAFVGHVEPFIARPALRGRAGPPVYVTSSERLPRHSRVNDRPRPRCRRRAGSTAMRADGRPPCCAPTP